MSREICGFAKSFIENTSTVVFAAATVIHRSAGHDSPSPCRSTSHRHSTSMARRVHTVREFRSVQLLGIVYGPALAGMDQITDQLFKFVYGPALQIIVHL